MTFKTYLLVILLCCAGFSAHAGDLTVQLNDAKGNPIKDAVIEIVSPKIPIPANWDYTGLIDQQDKEFVDNVVALVAGSYVTFPNSDKIQHHVYSFSKNNTFELPLYSGADAAPVLFSSPGVAIVGCNIHDWMLGYIYVGESHLMAVTDDSGAAVILDLPEGPYTFKLWHDRAKRKAQFSTHEVLINSAGNTAYQVIIDLGRERRIRRAPFGSQDAYH